MIIEVGGSVGGFKAYLVTGGKAGRTMHRDQLDQRIPLFGDLNVFEHVTTSYKTKGKRYDHLTFSFNENYVSDEMLHAAVSAFRNHIFSAWPESERHRIAFYAEAHRPKVLSYLNEATGERVQRYIHLHMGIGKQDLLTGKYLDLLGFLGSGSDNLKFIDCFQESFNTLNGFGSPKDHPRITPQNAIDILARYSGHVPDQLQSFNGNKSDLELDLQKQIIEKNVCSWSAFGKLLNEYGTVSKVSAGRFNEIYRVKLPGASKAMRLNGIFFSKSFIEKATHEKMALIMEQAQQKYREQMQPKKEAAYLTETLLHWHKFAAREIRYLHKSSRFYKNVYLPADPETRLKILDQLELKNNGGNFTNTDRLKMKEISQNSFPNDTAFSLDGTLASAYGTVENQSLPHKMSIDDAGFLKNGNWIKQLSGTLNLVKQTDGGAILRDGPSDLHTLIPSLPCGDRAALQPSSVLLKAKLELAQGAAKAKGEYRYAEIIKHIDCNLLLNRLTHLHGLRMEHYQVTEGKDSTPRIRCGSRSLSPSDFLTKELGLMWKEAAPILRQTYQIQLENQTSRARGEIRFGLLWKEFKDEQKSHQTEAAKQIRALNVEVRDRRAALVAKLRTEKNLALLDLYGAERKTALAIQNLRIATAKAEFQLDINEKRLVLRKNKNSDESICWPQFLLGRAQGGNVEALQILREIDDSERGGTSDTLKIFGSKAHEKNKGETYHLRINQIFHATILKGLTFSIGLNGDVTYLHKGCAVLRDDGRQITILDQYNEDAILAGLLLGREKFGQIFLTGSDDFKLRAVTCSVERSVAIIFADPILENLRQKLIEQKQAHAIDPVDLTSVLSTRATHHPLSVKSSTHPNPENVTSPNSDELVDKVAVRVEVESGLPEFIEPESARSWLEKWVTENNMVIIDAIPGSGIIPFVVLYKTNNEVVLHQGRTVAIYSMPGAIDLQIGEKVVVDKFKQVSPVFTNEQQRNLVKLKGNSYQR